MPDILLRVLANQCIIFFGEKVINQRMQTDTPPVCRLQAQQQMVDAPQPARGNEHQRIMMPGNVINGQQIAGQGHHQPSRSLQQHGVIASAQRLRSPLYLIEINRAAVYLRRQVRRTGITEYLGHRQPLVVFAEPARAHQPAVQRDYPSVQAFA